MLKFIIKRLLMMIPLMLGVSIVVFLFLHVGPNDPAMSYLRLSGIPPTDQALAEARIALGLNKPLIIQFFDWLFRAIQLDFGLSFTTGMPVGRQLMHYLPNTLYLASVSIFLTILFSVPLGILAAIYKNRWPDHISRVLAYIGVSMPSYWLGFLLIIVFAVKLQVLPSMGMGGLRHVILPATSIALMSMCINMRLIRGNMLEQMNSRYVQYAQIRGVKKGRIILHVLKNSFLPVLTALGMHIGEILGGAVVAEVIFSWPGIGRFAISALYNRDFPVMQCFVLLMTLLFVLSNLLVDLLYAVLDPRIRLDSKGQEHG